MHSCTYDPGLKHFRSVAVRHFKAYLLQRHVLDICDPMLASTLPVSAKPGQRSEAKENEGAVKKE
jgi:hypothetical protein